MAAVWTSALAELPALLLPGDRKTPVRVLGRPMFLGTKSVIWIYNALPRMVTIV